MMMTRINTAKAARGGCAAGRETDMSIEEEIRRWQASGCIETMQRSGFKAGDTVVDFGCGIGNYTFPLSRVVQEKGRVYAVDIDRYVLERIRERAEREDIHNISPMSPERDGHLRMEDRFADGLLLYDLIHSLGRREQALAEFCRVLKKGALLSILPFHMSGSQIKGMVCDIEGLGFSLDNIQRAGGIHFEMHRYLGRKSERLKDYERGDIYNFKKT